MASASKDKDQIETAPDPDEDELDDLDDVLDEFEAKPKLPSQPKPTESKTTAETSAPGRPITTSEAAAAVAEDEGEIPDDAELSKQLEAAMGNLTTELGSSPEMQKQFEDMMQELIAASAAPTKDEAAEHVKSAAESMPSAGSKKEDTFQDTIRKTMERMQASGDAATAASSKKEEKSEDELFAEMLKSLSQGDGSGEGMGSEEDFNSMLMSMMAQLTNKEILYEPMKELHDKFPSWMESHKDSEKKEDLDRYKEQQRLVDEIVARFEKQGYSDSNEDDREYIVERMQKMQAQGSPPPDLVGDMSAAQEALGDLDAGCPTQ